MDPVLRAPWIRSVVFFVLVAAVACGGSTGPTGPSTPTPAPTPVPTPTPVPVTACTANAPQPMTSFTADPATITDGDTLTLSWAAPCGFVTLAQKGKDPFAALQPSTGSYVLRPGQGGYPTAAGNTVYEARNADTATPREATVTVKQAIMVSVSASPDHCHPQKWDSKPCTVTCKADTTGGSSGALTYQWSGCASGGSSTGTCTFSQPGSSSCTVTVTDDKGRSATASKTVQGTNVAPGVTDPRWYNSTVPCIYKNCWFFVTPTDDDPQPSKSVVSCSAGAAPGTNGCDLLPAGGDGNGCYPNTGLPVDSGLAINMETNTSGTICQLRVTITDDWGASTVWTSPRYTIP